MNPATGAGGGAGVTVMLIDDVPGAPPLSVTEAVIVWLPTESVLTEIDAPAPMVPSALELQLMSDARLPSSPSFAVAVNVTVVVAGNEAPLTGAVMVRLGGVLALAAMA